MIGKEGNESILKFLKQIKRMKSISIYLDDMDWK